VELQRHLDELKRQGLGLVAVSYDSPATLADFARRRGITFLMLSDPGSKVIRQYGLLNTTVPAHSPAYGIPFPGTFILDTHERVVARFFEQEYEDRNTVSSILVRLGKDQGTGTKITSAHLDVVTWSSDDLAAPGTRLSLVLDVTPKAGAHVYAPGAKGYIPVALKLDPQEGVQLHPVEYPKPEDYYFKPLDEHVPVYQKRFRIVQDVTFDASRQGEAFLNARTSLTITGQLAYQACDDKVCFPPTSVPVSWTIKLRKLDRERVKHGGGGGIEN
jgi:AhpC/TSA family/Thiol:disulfide interchange protein DsbD, N-terminal